MEFFVYLRNNGKCQPAICNPNIAIQFLCNIWVSLIFIWLKSLVTLLWKLLCINFFLFWALEASFELFPRKTNETLYVYFFWCTHTQDIEFGRVCPKSNEKICCGFHHYEIPFIFWILNNVFMFSIVIIIRISYTRISWRKTTTHKWGWTRMEKTNTFP